MLSTLDWSLIAAWQEAGFPLEAVLSGIDATFEKYTARQAKGRVRRINGLAYCAQEVLRAVEDMHEAATGALRKQPCGAEESGFDALHIATFVRGNAETLRASITPEKACNTYAEISQALERIAESLESQGGGSTELLEQQLLVLEDQLFAALQAFTQSEQLLVLREQSSRELAPHRSRLGAAQVRQIELQFLRRSLFEQNHLPRLSLFYMRHT